MASGLIDRSEGRQISTLLYSMGPEAQDVLETTGIDEENRGVYDSVITSFDEYFGVRRNIIFFFFFFFFNIWHRPGYIQ